MKKILSLMMLLSLSSCFLFDGDGSDYEDDWIRQVEGVWDTGSEITGKDNVAGFAQFFTPAPNFLVDQYVKIDDDGDFEVPNGSGRVVFRLYDVSDEFAQWAIYTFEINSTVYYATIATQGSKLIITKNPTTRYNEQGAISSGYIFLE